ncbi:MAG: fused MFS/spermidine synthase [Candidatus Eisenbacteria sp.]|nr:fused MFS/spermidine synthase [Candidatus Eisenbacteria bacterium]
MKHNRNLSLRPVILGFFFFSGASSLAYEIIWTRQIAVLLGNTIYVIGMVLAAFMAGLAGGSVLIGRWADQRRDHLRIYGVLEIAVALYCLSLPWIISNLVPLFRVIYHSAGGSGPVLELSRALIALLLLLIPSFMMGGTLPVLAKLVARAPGTYGEDMGTLYAANTLGAVAGCLATGFLFVPAFGVQTTLTAAAAVATIVGILSLVLNRRAQGQFSITAPGTTDEPEGDSADMREIFVVGLIVFAVSGFAAMAYEVIWTRLIALFIGPSTYAFTIVLAAFISGLALGSIIYGKFASRFRNIWVSLGLLQVLVGISMLILMNMVGWIYESLREIMDLLRQRVLLLYLTEIVFAFLLLLVPTVFSGGTFPLVFQTLRAPRGKIGGSVGRLYAGNATGAVLGSLVACFVMIPALGIRGSLRLAIVVNLFLGLLLFLYVCLRKGGKGQVPVGRRCGVMVFATLGVIALALILPGWPRTLLISPPYMVVARNQPTFEEMKEKGWKILYFEEGINATVAVLEGPGLRLLSIEGKPDASAWAPDVLARRTMRGLPMPGGSDMRTQTLLGHVPMFSARSHSDVLIIGLASGVTIGSVEQHPGVRSVVCAEIAREMNQASRYFSYANHNALADPRLEIVYEDGRNHLLMNPGRYDVIISEPSNPWMPGCAKLFTREAFLAARSALKDGGVMCAWVESYSMQPEVMRSLLKSFLEVFPHASMFQIEDVDYCLIGSSCPLRIDESRWNRLMKTERVRRDLARISITDWKNIAMMCVGTTEGLREAVRDDVPNTDDNGRVEFLSPYAMTRNMMKANRAWISECKVSLSELLDSSVSDEIREEFREHFKAKLHD